MVALAVLLTLQGPVPLQGPVAPAPDHPVVQIEPFALVELARTGDEPPERPGASFTVFAGPSINAAGDVAFKGTFSGASANEGIYLYRDGALTRVVDDGFDQHPPGQSGATTYSSFGAPVLDDAGRVLFPANFAFGDGSQGLYVFDGGAVQRIFDDGPAQPVPGQPGAIGFTTFPFSAGVVPTLSAAGFGATQAHFFDGAFAEKTGLYAGSAPLGVFRVADQTQAPPGQGGALFTTFDVFLGMGADGDVVFGASYAGGSGARGLYRGDPAQQGLVRIADGSTVPPGQPASARFTDFGAFPSVGAAGRAAFLGHHTGGAGDSGIYLGDGVSPLQRIVDDSGAFAVPGHPGAAFVGFDPPVVTTRGDVFFPARFGPGPDDVGVFAYTGGALEELFSFADAVPLQPGAGFFALGPLCANRAGHLAFAGRTSGGTGNEGIYFWSGEALRRVTDESVALGPSAPDNLHMMLGIGGAGDGDGKGRALNQRDEMVFRASFAGGVEAVFLAVPRL